MSSIRSTARTQTAFLDSERLTDSMQTEDEPFDLQELATGKVTLYLVLPVDRLKSHGRWLRMILTLAIRAISRASDLPAVPVVFLLDELGTISPGSGLSMVEQSYGLMAGLGIRIWAFMQDLPQLKRDYPASWETFIANSSVIQLLNVGDNTTAKYFSEYLGNSTIDAKTGAFTYKQVPWSPGEWEAKTKEYARRVTSGKMYVNGSYIDATPEQIARDFMEKHGMTADYNSTWKPDSQLMSRPVRYPWEIVNASSANCFIIMPGLENFQLERIVYYTHPYLSKWARQDPNKPAMAPIAAPAAAVTPTAKAPPPPPPPPPGT